MPSWPVHIALANKLNKKLNLGDDFIIGNVLPDVLNGHIIKNPSIIKSSKTTHLKEENKLEDFIKRGKNNLSNPYLLGYLTHILTDNYFNKYFHKYHVTDKNGEKFAILKDKTLFSNPNIKPWQLKQQDFEIYGHKLSNENLLGNIVNNKTNTPTILSLTKNDITKTIDKINELISATYLYDKNSYKIFTEKELDNLYESCYQYLINYLENLK